MNAPVLKSFSVKLSHRCGSIKGRVSVKATDEQHAKTVAVAQVIEVSFPKSKPGSWTVNLVTAVEGGAA